jgi:hypothetical protein
MLRGEPVRDEGSYKPALKGAPDGLEFLRPTCNADRARYVA